MKDKLTKWLIKTAILCARKEIDLIATSRLHQLVNVITDVVEHLTEIISYAFKNRISAGSDPAPTLTKIDSVHKNH